MNSPLPALNPFWSIWIFFFLILPNILLGQVSSSTPPQERSKSEQFSEFLSLKNASLEQFESILDLISEYRFQSLDTAKLLSQQAQILSKPFVGKSVIGRLHHLRGLLALGEGNFETSMQQFLASIETWENLNQDSLLFPPYLNLGWIYFNMGQMEKSQEYLATASDIAEKRGNEDQLMRVKINQATIFMYLGEQYQMNQTTGPDSAKLYTEKAENTYKKVIILAERLGNLGNWASALNNLVVMKIKVGALSEALPLALEAEKKSIESKEIDLIVQSKYNLAYLYKDLEKPSFAVDIGESGLKLAKEQGLNRKQGIIEELLYQAYQDLGEFESANLHLKAYLEYVQETSDLETQKQLAEIESRFQLVQKEKQILELEKEKNIAEQQRNRIIIGSILTLIIGLFVYQLVKIRRDRNDRQAYAEALILAQEEERKRIARDLHDGVGQSLLILKKQMERAYENTLENQELITGTLEEVRSISRDLHPFQLEKFGLEAAVREAIQKIEKNTNIFITQEIASTDHVFSNKEEIHIYRTVQEALNNVVKHSEATAAKVSISTSSNEMLIRIQDNGKGFNTGLLQGSAQSLGLRTMQERIATIGGILAIESQNPKGTLVEIKLPLH